MMMLPEITALAPLAQERVAQALRRRGQHRLRDLSGRMIEVGPWRPDDDRGLLVMYDTLDWAQRAQGLPPLDADRRTVWVRELVDRGLNAVARDGDRVVGHAALMADGPGSYELVVFVHQDYQRAGIGRAVVDSVLELARERDALRIWLSVEPRNHRAVALYRRLGFQRVFGDGLEETWALALPQPAPTSVSASRTMIAAFDWLRRLAQAGLTAKWGRIGASSFVGSGPP